ncbi:MAG: hypothetical protein RB292_02240 [Patescibacteria group bacterium]|jgi:hypothetical protein|nr:hypothetical protein [Patescibacteria group bacterium]
MKIINRSIPIVCSLAILLLSELVLSRADLLWPLFSLAPLCLIAAIWQLTGRNLKSKKFWRLLITPLLFLVSQLGFLSFLEGAILRQLLVIFSSLVIWIFLQVIFLRFHSRLKYQLHSLESIATHIDLLTIFFGCATLFSLMLFLGVKLTLCLLIFAFITFLLSYQMIWVGEKSLADAWLYVMVITLISLEVFYAVSFLPTSVLVNSLIVTLAYYLMGGLTRNWLLDIREVNVAKRYLIISGILLLVVFLTAKWF